MTTTDDAPNYTAVTPRKPRARASGGGQAETGPHARATRARTRDRIVATVDATKTLVASRRGAPTAEEEAAPDVRGRSLWQDGPASPADMLEYTRSGAWAPGKQHPLVEFLGKAFGYTAFLLTLAAAVLLHVAQRPSRTLLALLVGFLLWWTFGGPGPAPAAEVAAP